MLGRRKTYKSTTFEVSPGFFAVLQSGLSQPLTQGFALHATVSNYSFFLLEITQFDHKITCSTLLLEINQFAPQMTWPLFSAHGQRELA